MGAQHCDIFRQYLWRNLGRKQGVFIVNLQAETKLLGKTQPE